jgi:hypothetical protein
MMSAEEFLAAKIPTPMMGQCTLCEKSLSADAETRVVDGGLAHVDCYFNELSDLVEKHPPGLPRQ